MCVCVVHFQCSWPMEHDDPLIEYRVLHKHLPDCPRQVKVRFGQAFTKTKIITVARIVQAKKLLSAYKFLYLLLTMYKCVNGSAPDYLCELISSYTPARRLRSLSQSLAVQPKVASNTYGERSFSFMGPFLWNSLPTWIRTLPSIPSFKKHLKTYLYKQQ